MKESIIGWLIIGIALVSLLLETGMPSAEIAFLGLSVIGAITCLKWIVSAFSESSNATDDIEQILADMTEQQNALSREYLARFLRDD